MEENQSRWEAIRQDLRINKPLVPLKLAVFTFSAATLLFVPYLTVHMVQIGLTVEEVAIIYSIQPFVSSLGPPIAGAIADRSQRYTYVLMAAMFLSGLCHTLLTTIDATGYTDVPLNGTDLATLGWVSVDTTGNMFRWTSCTTEACGNNSALATEDLMVKVVAADCIFECPEDYLRFCPESFGVCNNFNETVVVALKVSNSESITVANDTLCSVPIDTMMVSNATEPGSFESTCQVQCPVTILKPATLCNVNTTRFYDHAKHLRGFWIYFAIRILGTASLATSFSMLDATAICMVKRHKGEFGKQVMCAIFGNAVAGFTSGLLIDSFAFYRGYKDYSIVCYVSDGLLLLTLILVSRLEVEMDRRRGSFLKNVSKLVRLADVNFFLIFIHLLGTCWGFLESFLFIFLTELKAASSLLGLIVTVGSVTGLPFLYISDRIVKKTGKITVLIVAFACYATRFVGYSFITNPWHALPFECLEAITVHLLVTASAMFCSSAAPPGVFATMNGLARSLHFSAGHGVGTLIGSALAPVYGIRTTFRIFGTAAAIAGTIYAVLYWFILRRMELKRLHKRSEAEAAIEALQRMGMLVGTEGEPKLTNMKANVLVT